MCSEILSICKTFIETPKRKFDNNTYWDVLSKVTTKLGKETCAEDNITDDIALSKIAASIFDHSKKSTSEQTVDYSLLDDNVMSALNGDVLNNGDGDGDGDGDEDGDGNGDANNNEDDGVNNEESAEVEIDINNGIGNKRTKVKKVNVHDAATVNILKNGIDKMKAKNLPAVRYRKNCRLAREQVALRDSIYNNMMNIKDNNFINVTIDELNKEDDGNIFGNWDSEIKSLI